MQFQSVWHWSGLSNLWISISILILCARIQLDLICVIFWIFKISVEIGCGQKKICLTAGSSKIKTTAFIWISFLLRRVKLTELRWIRYVLEKLEPAELTRIKNLLERSEPTVQLIWIGQNWDLENWYGALNMRIDSVGLIHVSCFCKQMQRERENNVFLTVT